jgi:hypothetical protein
MKPWQRMGTILVGDEVEEQEDMEDNLSYTFLACIYHESRTGRVVV